MPTKVRPSPAIPDHDVLRKIGGGAYGEVWLARGVTGALRAVKVVWREDFEDKRGFEREFEGILKYEPISRDHPALVNILHVGRSPDGETFYYYVMELGDDVTTGRDINPVEYEPKTLRADHHQGIGEQWPTDDCLDIGLRLAEALDHLHKNGLAHRDVKPSNVIFVNGRAKLADIGLVAARGQRTFVGTEGFVPPEGPGSAQADIYSLGKVLYEIATGMDRMNFPELPEEMPSGTNRRRWLELNQIICEICEPRVSKRKISQARQLVESLRRLQRGKRRRQSGLSLLLTAGVLALFGGWVGWQAIKDTEWVKSLQTPDIDTDPAMGLYRVFSTPEGADVYDENGDLIATTPTPTIAAQVGDEVSFTLRKDGYRPLELGGMVSMASSLEPMILHGEMQVFAPPRVGEPWVDQFGESYLPEDERHVSSGFISKQVWSRGMKELNLPKNQYEFVTTSENGFPVDIVLTKDSVMKKFVKWFREGAIRKGFLTDEYEVKGSIEMSFISPEMSEAALNEDLRPFRISVRKVEYGQLYVTTDPPGAELFVNKVSEGFTHGELIVSNVKPGPISLHLVLEGYKPLTKKLVQPEGELLEVHLELKKNQGVVFGRPWRNSVKMEFQPFGDDLMVSKWETRLKDYEVFMREVGYAAPRPPAFEQGETHPVVNVTREDAEEFCAWLTKRERRNERISQAHEYRLPTDLEWSHFAGLNDESEAASPNSRDAKKKSIFPWGAYWPNGDATGNFGDITAAMSPGVDIERTILGYDDGHAFTAPVGSYAANKFGLFDISGNVQEWVSDKYSTGESSTLGVLRGGGWNTYQLENLYVGSRNAVPPNFADSFYGFRVVLAKLPVTEEDED